MPKEDPQGEGAKNMQIFLNRLRMLESNMARLTSQHQALAPLADLVGLIPEVGRHKSSIQMVEERLKQLGVELKQLLGEIKKAQTISPNQSLKEVNNQMAQLRREVKLFQEASKKRNKQHFYKTRIRTTVIHKNAEAVLEDLKKDVMVFTESFKNTLTSQSRRIPDSKAVETAVSDRTRQSELWFDNHVVNLKRQLGLLQCEIQYIRDKELRAKIQRAKETSPVSLATLEHQFYMDNFIEFEESNVDRIKFQLEVLHNGLKNFPLNGAFSKRNLQLQYFKDRHYSLANQVQGTKHKKLQDILKLQNKLQRLDLTIIQTDREESQKFTVSQLKSQLRQARSIGENHNKYLQQYIEAIDAKFKQIKRIL